MVSKEIEEYLECIYRGKEKGRELRGKEIAKELSISHASVSEMLKKMDQQGLVYYKPYKPISLTSKGEKLGKKILKKHRFLEGFLSYLGIAPKKAHKEACKLEHVFSDDVEAALGKKIKTGKWEDSKIIPVTQLKPGEKAIIAYILGGRRAIKRLTDMGLTPGTQITTKKEGRNCPLQICVRRTCLCVGRGIADKIFVEVNF